MATQVALSRRVDQRTSWHCVRARWEARDAGWSGLASVIDVVVHPRAVAAECRRGGIFAFVGASTLGALSAAPEGVETCRPIVVGVSAHGFIREGT